MSADRSEVPPGWPAPVREQGCLLAESGCDWSADERRKVDCVLRMGRELRRGYRTGAVG